MEEQEEFAQEKINARKGESLMILKILIILGVLAVCLLAGGWFIVNRWSGWAQNKKPPTPW